MHFPDFLLPQRRHGVFLFWIFIGLIGMLKSYPCIGDMAPYISLLPLFHVLNLARMRSSLPLDCDLIN